MAKDKKSFVAYCDWIETFDELSDAEAGRLIKHILLYVNDKDPKASDQLTKMCFIPIKQTLKRDLSKYEGYIQKQRENGAKGGRPKKSQLTQRLISEPKKADSVSVSVSVSDSVNDIKNKKEVIAKAPKFNFRNALLDYGFKEVLVNDWIAVRSKKKASNTITAFKGFINQVEKRSEDKNMVLQTVVERSWTSFKSEWMDNKNGFNNNAPQQKRTYNGR